MVEWRLLSGEDWKQGPMKKHKPNLNDPDDYADYLDWLDEQPCLNGCYEDNRHCVCRELDALWEGFTLPAEAELEDNDD